MAVCYYFSGLIFLVCQLRPFPLATATVARCRRLLQLPGDTKRGVLVRVTVYAFICLMAGRYTYVCGYAHIHGSTHMINYGVVLACFMHELKHLWTCSLFPAAGEISRNHRRMCENT